MLSQVQAMYAQSPEAAIKQLADWMMTEGDLIYLTNTLATNHSLRLTTSAWQGKSSVVRVVVE